MVDDDIIIYTPSAKRSVFLSKELHIDSVVESAINQLYDDRSIDKQTRNALFNILRAPLKDAVNEGVGKVATKVEYGTPNYDMLKNLQTNVAVFAMFKNHAMVKEMVSLLKDSDGNLRSKEDFRKEALKVDSTYRVTYLDAEYDTAVRASRSATMWTRALQTKHLYPNLKYLHTKSLHPRQDHLAYVGIIRPIEDPFWITHTPPNGWKCQCGYEPTDEDTSEIPDNLPPPAPGFAFNPGMTGQVFDLKDSSYIKSVPPKEQPKLIKEAQSVVNKEMAKETPSIPVYESKSTGNEVTASPLAHDNSDFNEVLKIARSLANYKEGPAKIEILPKLDDPDLRTHLLPGAKDSKNPDYKIGSDYADLKTVTASGKKSVMDALDRARQQGDAAVIEVADNNKLSYDEVVAQIVKKMSFKEMQDFGDIWLNYKGKWTKNPHKKEPQ